MKIIITEQQYKLIVEQKPDELYDKQFDALVDVCKSISPHTWMTIAQIGTSFIPLIGPVLSMGIGLADASMYYNEGDKKTAGMIGLFSVIPGIGGLASKLGLGNVSAKVMGEIGKKVSFGSKLTASETKIVNQVAKHKQLLKNEISKLSKAGKSTSLAKQGVKSQLKKQAITKNVGKFAGTVAGYGATGSVYGKTYDNLQKNTPKHKAESKGLNWELVKQSFGSSGSEEDNKLLNAALDKGWKPGQVVPQGLQTQLYKTEYTNDVNRIKGLQSLIANAKTK